MGVVPAAGIFLIFFREGAHKMDDFLHLYMRGQEAPDKMKGGV